MAYVENYLAPSMSITDQGHREYSQTFKVVAIGPEECRYAVGLPAVGSTYQFNGQSDAWAFRTPGLDVRPMVEDDSAAEMRFFVDVKWSTVPRKRCSDTEIENPLQEPYDISGGINKETEEAQTDRDGDALLYSNYEQMRGPLLERDRGLPTIQIAWNLPQLQLALWLEMMDCVNDTTLWSFAPETVKFDSVRWQRRLYGVCFYYYNVVMDFKVDPRTFTRFIVDEGTRYLLDGGTPTNPDHYATAKDPTGENTVVLLDGQAGLLPLGSPPHVHEKYLYQDKNLLLLGIPSQL